MYGEPVLPTLYHITQGLSQEDEPGVQEQALSVLTRMAQHQTQAFSEYVELVLPRTLHAFTRPAKAVMQAADECLHALCKHLSPARLLDTLQPMLPLPGAEVPGEGVVEYQALSVSLPVAVRCVDWHCPPAS